MFCGVYLGYTPTHLDYMHLSTFNLLRKMKSSREHSCVNLRAKDFGFDF